MKFKIKTSFNVPETFYLLALGLHICVSIFEASLFAHFFTATLRIAIVYFCAALIVGGELLKTRITIKEIVFGVVCLFLAGILYKRAFEAGLIFLLVFAGRKVDFKKTAQCVIIVSCISTAFIILCAHLGIIKNYVDSNLEGTEFRVRRYLGFLYALFPSAILFNVTSLDLYIHRNFLSWKRCLFWLGVNFYIFLQTDSRLSFGTVALEIVLLYLIGNQPKIKEICDKYSFPLVFSCIFSACFMIFFTLSYNPRKLWMRRLDKLIGYRLHLGYNAMRLYPVTLFGQKVKFIGNGLQANGKTTAGTYNYVDCLYESILIRFGLVFLAITVALLSISLVVSWKERNYSLLIILSIFSFHGILDDLIINLQYNTFWIVVGLCIVRHYSVCEEQIAFENIRLHLPKSLRKSLNFLHKRGVS